MEEEPPRRRRRSGASPGSRMETRDNSYYKKRYEACVTLADGLVQRAKEEKDLRETTEKKYKAAVGLAEGLRMKIIEKGSLKESASTTVQTSKKKTAEKVYVPAEDPSKKKVQESASDPSDLIEVLSKQYPGFNG